MKNPLQLYISDDVLFFLIHHQKLMIIPYFNDIFISKKLCLDNAEGFAKNWEFAYVLLSENTLTSIFIIEPNGKKCFFLERHEKPT